jgi:hypothetical protein
MLRKKKKNLQLEGEIAEFWKTSLAFREDDVWGKPLINPGLLREQKGVDKGRQHCICID